MSLTSRKNFVNYIVGLTAAYLIGFVLFIFVPTYMDRVKEGLLVICYAVTERLNPGRAYEEKSLKK